MPSTSFRDAATQPSLGSGETLAASEQPTSRRSVGYVSLLVSGLIAICGILTRSGPSEWVQAIAQISPMYWLGLGMRSALLPDCAYVAEIAGSWRPLEATWCSLRRYCRPARGPVGRGPDGPARIGIERGAPPGAGCCSGWREAGPKEREPIVWLGQAPSASMLVSGPSMAMRILLASARVAPVGARAADDVRPAPDAARRAGEWRGR